MSYHSELAIQVAAHAERGRAVRAAVEAGINETLTDLRERLLKAQAEIQTMVAVEAGHGNDPERLRGKAQGVGLALSYMDEALRAEEQP